jgi:hypothetical protein
MAATYVLSQQSGSNKMNMRKHAKAAFPAENVQCAAHLELLKFSF